ncbi:MAG: hypothetical protein AAGA06_00620 [Pseudomonadota bacterium]
MTAVLASDALISVLAGIGMLFLRRALLSVDLMPWLRSSLRFGCFVLAAFYLLRPAVWIWDNPFVERLLLIAAALVPLAVLLITEAALKRHAHVVLKWVTLVGTVFLVLGALIFPGSLTTHYLAALLVFQVVVLVAAAVMLWRQSCDLEASDRSLVRTFAVLVLLSLPVIVLESAVLGSGGPLHLSALVLLVGVWLLFCRSIWLADVRRMWRWGATLIMLAAVAGWVMSLGRPDVSVLTFGPVLLAVLVFASLVAIQLARASTGFEVRLLNLLAQPLGRDNLRQRVMEILSDHNIASVPEDYVASADVPAITERLHTRPVWTSAERGSPDDADQALADIAKRADATHLVALGPKTTDLVGLKLGPAESSVRLIPLLTALARRFDEGARDER